MGSDECLTNRILITCPRSSECSFHGLWFYYRSFLKHLRETHSCNQQECRELLGKAIITSIENAVGSENEIDYVDMIKQCVEKIVSSSNDRNSVPFIPPTGNLLFSKDSPLS